MLQTLKKYIILAAIAGIVYYLLSHHLIFFGRDLKILPKTSLTFENTFYNIGDIKEAQFRDLESIFRKNPDLREAGLGSLLVDMGIITQDELFELEQKIDSEW